MIITKLTNDERKWLITNFMLIVVFSSILHFIELQLSEALDILLLHFIELIIIPNIIHISLMDEVMTLHIDNNTQYCCLYPTTDVFQSIVKNRGKYRFTCLYCLHFSNFYFLLTQKFRQKIGCIGIFSL